MIRSQKKIILLLFHLVCCVFTRAQVSINNTNPQGIFHVDGAKDNPAAGTPTTAQQANDFVVKADGKVGIGTTNPADKIEVAGGNISISSYEYKTPAADEQKAGELSFRLGGSAAERTTPVAGIVGYDKYDGTYLGDLGFKTQWGHQLYERMRVTAKGNIGIGTTTPAVKLEINNGTTAGAIKITDGTQGAGKVLTSDAAGVGTWTALPALRSVVTGSYLSNANYVSPNTLAGTTYIGTYIDLTRGKWILNAGLAFTKTGFQYSRNWLQVYLSTSTTIIENSGFSHFGFSSSGNPPAYVGGIHISDIGEATTTPNSYLNFVTGSALIEVTEPTVRIFLLVANKGDDAWRYTSGATAGTAGGGNYFYALPVN